MSHSHSESGIATHRLSAEAYHQNFSDLHPALDGHEALVAADRCYFCYDAPCITACPPILIFPYSFAKSPLAQRMQRRKPY